MMKIGSEKGTRKIFSVEKRTSVASSINMARFARVYFPHRETLLHARYDTVYIAVALLQLPSFYLVVNFPITM